MDMVTCFLPQTLSLMSLGPFKEEEQDYLFPNLLGFHPIDDWIEGRRDGHIEVGNQYVEGVRNIVTKTMSEDREYGWYVEYKNDTNMGATCVEGFLAGILGWKVKDSAKDESVRDANEDQV